MKATIQSTDQVVTLDAAGEIKAGVWEGVTDKGVKFTAYIPVVQLHKSEDATEFERALKEHKAPEPHTNLAIDLLACAAPRSTPGQDRQAVVRVVGVYAVALTDGRGLIHSCKR